MNTRFGAGSAALAVVGLLLLAEHPVLAYIDPGSGSLIYQALLAGLLGLGFTLRRTTDAVGRFLRKLKGDRT